MYIICLLFVIISNVVEIINPKKITPKLIVKNNDAKKYTNTTNIIKYASDLFN
jgi:hypothetical protein